MMEQRGEKRERKTEPLCLNSAPLSPEEQEGGWESDREGGRESRRLEGGEQEGERREQKKRLIPLFIDRHLSDGAGGHWPAYTA